MAKLHLEPWLGRTLLASLLPREHYGLELVDRAEIAWRHDYPGEAALDEGSVYASLRGLEHRGLLVGKWVKVGVDRPRRRYYTLTPRGQRVADRQLAAAPGVSRAIGGVRP